MWATSWGCPSPVVRPAHQDVAPRWEAAGPVHRAAFPQPFVVPRGRAERPRRRARSGATTSRRRSRCRGGGAEVGHDDRFVAMRAVAAGPEAAAEDAAVIAA